MFLLIVFAQGLPITIDTNNVKKIVSDGCVDIIVIDGSAIPAQIKDFLLQEALKEAGFPEEKQDNIPAAVFSINIEPENASLAAFIPATPFSFDGCSEIPLTLFRW
jgi:hypothetical protein